MPDRDDWLIERVWALHCRGKTVTEIGRRLVIEPAEARFIIVEIWKAEARFIIVEIWKADKGA